MGQHSTRKDDSDRRFLWTLEHLSCWIIETSADAPPTQRTVYMLHVNFNEEEVCWTAEVVNADPQLSIFDDDDDDERINFSVALSSKTTRTRNNKLKQ